MTNIKALSISVILFTVFIGTLNAQTKLVTGTVKGNYCGHGSGGLTWPASVGFIVGSERWVFDFESRDRSVRRKGFSLATVKVGDEFSIKYLVRRGIPYITSISYTGKKKPVNACSL